MYDDDEELEERDPEEIQPMSIYPPADCFICGRPGCRYGCFRCGFPVCYSQDGYFSDSTCGGWILDTWHPGHPHENEFYCNICLQAGLIPDAGLVIAGIPIKADNGVIEVTVGGQVQQLSEEETKDLIAYLFTERGELFGKTYDPDAEEVLVPEPVTASDESVTIYQDGTFMNCPPLEAYQQSQKSEQGGQDQDDSLGDLEDHPF